MFEYSKASAAGTYGVNVDGRRIGTVTKRTQAGSVCWQAYFNGQPVGESSTRQGAAFYLLTNYGYTGYTEYDVRRLKAAALVREADRLTAQIDALWTQMSGLAKMYPADLAPTLQRDLEAFNQLGGSAAGVQELATVIAEGGEIQVHHLLGKGD